jgi:MerR family transcriptional regulator/heat shock protein HspR
MDSGLNSEVPIDRFSSAWYTLKYNCLLHCIHREKWRMLDDARPVYTIGTAAEILGVHPRTLRLYEDGGLIRPARKRNRRYYTNHDLEWIICLRYLIHHEGLNQEGLRRLLARIPCWEIRGCQNGKAAGCRARAERCTPCWDLARREDGDARACYSCTVYRSAPNHLMTKEERGRALGDQPSP